MNDNRKVVDLKKVQWASLYYTNGRGNVLDKKPEYYSVNGATIMCDDYAYPHMEYPMETCLERAKRLDILDTWVPRCTLQLTANHCLVYEGEKALAIWKAWRAKIFDEPT